MEPHSAPPKATRTQNSRIDKGLNYFRLEYLNTMLKTLCAAVLRLAPGPGLPMARAAGTTRLIHQTSAPHAQKEDIKCEFRHF